MARRKSSEEVVSSTTFQRDFRRIAQKVHAGETHFVIKTNGLEVGAFIPMDEYKELMHEREQREQDEEESQARVKEFERLA